MIAIEDPLLPGLSALDDDTLQRITGSARVSLMRLRYRAGDRAVLHLETGGAGARQGSVWFFRGDKAMRLARRTGGAAFDEATQALYESFPNDHRMPQIRAFVDGYARVAPGLLAGRPQGTPQLVRYRPGLSCTFRCGVAGRGAVFVKLVNDDSPARIAVMNRRMTGLLAGEPLSIAPVIATDAGLSAISYGAARGRPLDAELAATGGTEPLLQGIDALRRLWRLPVTPTRQIGRAALARRAAESVALIGALAPGCLGAARRVFDRIEASAPPLACRPIHADVKLEHVFLDGGRTTLIDTESVALGPPDYDLAGLYGRLWHAELHGQLPRSTVAAAAGEIRIAAGAGFRWCLDEVALRLAKFEAQRPSPGSEERIAGLLERLA